MLFAVLDRRPFMPASGDNNEAIVRDPEVLGGVPVFRGTRVPFQTLLEYIEGGQTLDEFLDDFPTVTRDAAIRALEHAKSLVINQTR
jgi:uncharacterized protein (DUF433 family)